MKIKHLKVSEGLLGPELSRLYENSCDSTVMRYTDSDVAIAVPFTALVDEYGQQDALAQLISPLQHLAKKGFIKGFLNNGIFAVELEDKTVRVMAYPYLTGDGFDYAKKHFHEYLAVDAETGTFAF